MKKLFFALISLVVLMSSCSSKYELFEETDKSLETEYKSYGLFTEQYEVFCCNGYYKIMPLGRLINVRIEEVVDDEKYEKLKKSFKNHYKNDIRVNDVYICNGGTIMIDCRD